MVGVTGVTVMFVNVGLTKNPLQLDRTMMPDRIGISLRPDFETRAVRKSPPSLNRGTCEIDKVDKAP
jgi:hypothetical protein